MTYDNADDEFTDEHAERSPDEQRTTAETLNGPKRHWCRADVDKCSDERDEEGVLNCPQRLEEDGAKVEDKVDAGKLLHHLERGAENGQAEVGVGSTQTASEACLPGSKVRGGRDESGLVLVVCDDFLEFGIDEGRVLLATDTQERLTSAVDTAALDKVSGRLGKKEETESENHGPQELDGDGDTVRTRVHAVLGGIVDARGEEETNGDTELVATDKSATDFTRSNLGHVENNDSRLEAYAYASNGTAGDEKLVVGRGHLEDDTDDEDEAAADDRCPASKVIREITGNDGTKECTRGEDRGDERLHPRRNLERVLLLLRRVRSGNVLVAKLFDEEWHGHHTGNVTNVISKEDASKGCERAGEVRLYSDGRLDMVDVHYRVLLKIRLCHWR